MIPALPLDVAQQEEMPHGEGRRSQVAATHDERERPGHRHDEHDGHDRHDGHDAGEQGGRRAARRPRREAADPSNEDMRKRNHQRRHEDVFGDHAKRLHLLVAGRRDALLERRVGVLPENCLLKCSPVTAFEFRIIDYDRSLV